MEGGGHRGWGDGGLYCIVGLYHGVGGGVGRGVFIR